MGNAFTLDGRLKPAFNVTPTKVLAVKGLIEKALNGDFIAGGTLKEALSSSDALFSYSYLTNLNFLPQFDRLTPTWTEVASKSEVADFKKPVRYSLVTDWAGIGTNGTAIGGLGSTGSNPDNVAPIVAEGETYPTAYMAGEEAATAGINKRGFQTDFTFEAFINDALGFIAALPGEMLRVAADTQDWEVYQALINSVSGSQQIQGGVTPDGTTVLVNAPFSRSALIRALYELSQRKINNRYVQITGGYNLIVPIGQKAFVSFALNQTYATVQDGSFQLNIDAYNPVANVTIVESQWITGTAWYVVPKPGATARPVLEHATLRGHEAAELRIENFTGNYVGGATVSPFEGSFNNDSTALRIRLLGGGILWTPSLVVWSTGAGS